MPIEHGRSGVDPATLTAIVVRAWRTLVGDDLVPLDGASQVSDPMCSSIAIGGPWSATVVVSVERAAAQAGASSLLGVEPRHVDESDVLDLLGELANIVGGNVKGFVSGARDGEWTLSLPVVSAGVQTVPGSRCALQLGFAGGSGGLACELREHAGAPERPSA